MAKRNLMNGSAIPMEPGERNKAVTIQQLTESTATSGFPKESWSTLVTPVYMRKLDTRGDERFKADQIAASYQTQWEMGYRTDMDPELVDVAKKRRLVFQSRVHQIVMGSVIGQREGIELLTIAGSGGER
jgi:head-tail adaptor